MGRTQAVVLEGDSPEEVPDNSGMSQDSVLGSHLFLLYINDLPQDIKSQVRFFTVRNDSYSKTYQADLDRLEIGNEPGT